MIAVKDVNCLITSTKFPAPIRVAVLIMPAPGWRKIMVLDAVAVFQCVVCLEDVSSGTSRGPGRGGVLPCCHKVVHVSCFARAMRDVRPRRCPHCRCSTTASSVLLTSIQ